jgi:hypothetical protein
MEMTWLFAAVLTNAHLEGSAKRDRHARTDHF